MDLEDGDAAMLVRTVHQHLAIKAPCPQQCRIKYFRPVGRGQQDKAAGRVKTVQLDQQLVEGLLPFVIAAHAGRRSSTAQGVQFIDKDNGRG